MKTASYAIPVALLCLAAPAALHAQSLAEDGFKSPIQSGTIHKVRVTDEGKIFAVGNFNISPGGNAQTIRLHPNGWQDATHFPSLFQPQTGSARTFAHPHGTGTILIGGDFTDPSLPDYLVLVNANGTINNDLLVAPNAAVHAVERAPDPNNPSIYIGGAFSTINGDPAPRIARLLGGKPDEDFTPPPFIGTVMAILPLANGQVIVAGDELEINGAPEFGKHIFRLNDDGTRDPAFHFDFIDKDGGTVHALALQQGGKIIIGGDFQLDFGGGSGPAHYTRILPNGDPDPAFTHAFEPNQHVLDVAVQADGGILLAGEFTTAPAGSAHFARLHPHGAIDDRFAPDLAPDDVLRSIAVQGEGSVLFAGTHEIIGSHGSPGIFRIRRHGGLDLSLDGIILNVRQAALDLDGNLVVAPGFPNAILNVAHGSDGSRIPDFATQTFLPSDRVHSILIQPDGKILLAGNFAIPEVGGFARVLSTGDLDPGFSPPLEIQWTSYNSITGDSSSPRLFHRVFIEMDRHGRIYVGGPLRTHGSLSSYTGAVRLFQDGTLDADYRVASGLPNNIPSNANAEFNVHRVSSMSLDWDQEKLTVATRRGRVAGELTIFPNPIRRHMPIGNIDNSFSMAVMGELDVDDITAIPFSPRYVSAMQPLPGNGFQMGGFFNNVYSVVPDDDSGIIIINPLHHQANTDSRFAGNYGRMQPGPTASRINDMVIDAGDRSYVIHNSQPGDYISTNPPFNLLPKPDPLPPRFARYGPPTSTTSPLDPTFTQRPGYDEVERVIPLPDGKLLVLGTFSSIDGVSRPGIARLGNLDAIPEENLVITPQGGLRWDRRHFPAQTGSRPQVLISTDGSVFQELPDHMIWDDGGVDPQIANLGFWSYPWFKDLPIHGEFYLKTRAQLANQGGIFESPVHRIVTSDVPFPTANLAVEMTTSADEIQVGDNVTFTITAQNLGPSIANNVVVAQYLPDSYTFVGATPSTGTYNSATGIWSVGTLANGATATMEVVATPQPATDFFSLTPDFENLAFISGDVRDNFLANNQAAASITLIRQAVDLEITATVSNPTPAPEETITITLEVTNHGPVESLGTRVPISLPSGYELVSVNPIGGAFSNFDDVWYISRPALLDGTGIIEPFMGDWDDPVELPFMPGQTATLEIEAEIRATGIHTPATFEVTSDEIDLDPSNNITTLPIQIVDGRSAELVLEISIDNPNALPGEEVQITATITNLGPEQALNVHVFVPLPDGLTFVNRPPLSHGQYFPTTGRWIVTSLMDPANATFDLPSSRTTIINALVNPDATSYTINGSTTTNATLINPAGATATASLNPASGSGGIGGSLVVHSITPVAGNQREIVLRYTPPGPGTPVLDQSTDLGLTDPWTPVPAASFTPVPGQPGVLETTITRPMATPRLFFRATLTLDP